MEGSAGSTISGGAEENRYSRRRFSQFPSQDFFPQMFQTISDCWCWFAILAVFLLGLAKHQASTLNFVRMSSNMVAPFNFTQDSMRSLPNSDAHSSVVNFHAREMKLVLIAIPKTATRSLQEWLKKYGILQEVDNLELCYHRMYDPVGFNVVFLRNPLKHIFSQFLECKYDQWGEKVTEKTNFPKDGPDHIGMQRWVTYFHDVWKNPSQSFFECYNPYNLQARYMTCKSSNQEYDAHGLFDSHMQSPPIEVAKRNLDNLQFVGIVDYFKESLCMLGFLCSGVVSKFCTCKKLSQWKIPHISHSVPKHSLSQLSLDTLEKMKGLSKVDLELYRYGLRRFLKTLTAFEKYTQREILCQFKRVEIITFLDLEQT